MVDTSLVVGSRLNLTIQVLNLGPRPEDMDAWEFHLELNASILRITRVLNGPVLDDIAEDSGGVTLYSRSFNATTGTAGANELLIIDTPQPVDAGFTGSGDLAYVEVSVLALGVSFINFTDTKLRDIDGQSTTPIQHGFDNGLFCNVTCNLLPVADFTIFPRPIKAGGVITFDASGSRDPDGTIVQYAWDFGDGSPIAQEPGPITVHTYAAPQGPLTVVLNVTDNNGGIGTMRVPGIYVESTNRPPVAIFDFSPVNPETLTPVTFNASRSYDPEGQLAILPQVPFKWDFGDGGLAGGEVVHHTYTRTGNFTVILTVVDEADQETKNSTIITVGQGVLRVQTESPWWIIPSAGVAAVVAAMAILFLWRRRRARAEESEI
jgi:PKD repeat protein